MEKTWWLCRLPVVHWPRALAAQAAGHTAKWLYVRHAGIGTRALRLAGWLWSGVPHTIQVREREKESQFRSGGNDVGPTTICPACVVADPRLRLCAVHAKTAARSAEGKGRHHHCGVCADFRTDDIDVLIAHVRMHERMVGANDPQGGPLGARHVIQDAHNALDAIGAPTQDAIGLLTLAGRCWALSNRWSEELQATMDTSDDFSDDSSQDGR